AKRGIRGIGAQRRHFVRPPTLFGISEQIVRGRYDPGYAALWILKFPHGITSSPHETARAPTLRLATGLLDHRSSISFGRSLSSQILQANACFAMLHIH